ncbi:MAG: hypothetical protein A3J10_02305 [Candidatus Sungbacteria bacterium RIFCSPLOWO2_02_FULL_54_10]|uniref:DUF86 domain-containing protein n=2 Tax=Candidatus Sungiibacteriota TaxID=1817917 RepID=A0A1G2L618_9BACT|nr:MAG: hypothetical protein A2679_01235 [Candidatus Sungbacteria bacterium RIFCSPHIGHO2_01_FULL_54_26]OHA03291.1 MAG: hypothetical protein A3C92_03420 [Candidatus Sungbacteria bacterium RIFCSPHIGHO2_02_FULL_53_17]OHA07108.1 MAG: hypothetical protein A3B34_02080 [Candidatus Sungbacteria bacterium RIFCSPLOWO2_01_FULL_54_21]OHA12339.1 MAG: hypothetical protein A3J10_02305 [Candidatus Sungbacteria bacterium RIFCSPLOWO2_02_FULL_54_10]
MGSELIFKKLEQIAEVVSEMERLLAVPLGTFVRDLTAVRAAERNFQLAVDLASDCNAQILIERGGKTPDTYRESFAALEREGILSGDLARRLMESAKVRNILVHEYDFEEDYEKFYHAAQASIPAYREYTKSIYDYIRK